MPSPADLGSGRYANKGFRHTAGIADMLTWVVLLALVVAVVGNAVWTQGQLSNPDSPAAMRGLTSSQIWTGSLVSLVLFYAIVAPLVLIGLWLTSLIFKFKLTGGSYLRAAAVAAVPVVLLLGYSAAVTSNTMPNNPVVTAIVVALAVPIAALLARGSFGLTPIETIVAALIAAPLGAVGLYIDTQITNAAVAAGRQPGTVAMTPPAAPSPPDDLPVTPPPARTLPQPMVVTPPIRSAPVPDASSNGPTVTENLVRSQSPADRDTAAIQQLRVDAESFVDSEIAPSRLAYLRSHLESLHGRVGNLQRQYPSDVTLATVAHQLDEFQLKLDAPPPQEVATNTPRPEPLTPIESAPTPVPANPIDAALARLNAGNVFEKKAALASLAKMPADPTRADVTRALDNIVLADDGALRESAAEALSVWADTQTVIKLLPWLDADSPSWHVDSAMKILAPTHDKRAVMPILLWLVKRPEPATAALITLGPVAEDELDKAVRDPNADGRKYAARVLQEIGGQKSLIPLQKAAADQRDPSAQQAAKIALEIVRERWKASRASATKPG